MMRRFRKTIDDLGLAELQLLGRLYTWSSERDNPTLERINRAFASVQCLEQYPTHTFRAISSDCSDHAPLLLLNTKPWARPRFRFALIWVKFDGFIDVMQFEWS